jgi:hypothetical protein
MERFMKAAGPSASEKVEEGTSTLTSPSMMENGRMTRDMGLEDFGSLTRVSSKVSSKKTSRSQEAVRSSLIQKATSTRPLPIQDTSRMERSLDMELRLSLMEMCMKESSRMG